MALAHPNLNFFSIYFLVTTERQLSKRASRDVDNQINTGSIGSKRKEQKCPAREETLWIESLATIDIYIALERLNLFIFETIFQELLFYAWFDAFWHSSYHMYHHLKQSKYTELGLCLPHVLWMAYFCSFNFWNIWITGKMEGNVVTFSVTQ